MSGAGVNTTLGAMVNVLSGNDWDEGLAFTAISGGLGGAISGYSAAVSSGRGIWFGSTPKTVSAPSASLNNSIAKARESYDNSLRLKESSGMSPLTEGELLRIENAATRIKKPIAVVDSRANGTAGAYSDWDYVIEGLNSRNWDKIKNSLPGSRSILDNTPRNIDIFKGPLDLKKPYIIVKPRL